MNGSLLLALAVAAVGSDFGWQPLPGGGLEYIIQIEPHLVDRLREGTDFVSYVPANVKNIRKCRFRVGSEKLPTVFDSPDGKPSKLPWEDDIENKVKPAAIFRDAGPTPAVPETPPTTEPDRTEPDPPSHWLLTALAIGLMSTSAGMVFSGWTAWDYRSRYRRVLERLTVKERIELEMAGNSGD